METEFDEFVRQFSRPLLRAAWLLTGDWWAAEDVVQSAFAAVWKRWDIASRADSPAAYTHRVLVHEYLRTRRRRWRGEVSVGSVPDTAVQVDEAGDSDLREAFRQALTRLSERQRAVIVLRHFLDLSEADTAAALGCAVGTVKSHHARALAALSRDPALAGRQPEDVT